MKFVSAHQPAFLPWLGLIHKVMLSDIFIFMDIAKFRKRAFMHRNYIEINQKENVLGLNVNDKADYLNCDEVKISAFHSDCLNKIKNKIETTYKNTEYFEDLIEFLSNTFEHNQMDLNSICLKQLLFLKDKFEIKTQIIKESKILSNNFKSTPTERLLQHAIQTKANIYITGTNSVNYLEKKLFDEHKIFNYVQKFNYLPFSKYQFTNHPLSTIHQISKIGFKKIKKMLVETQINKQNILEIYDRSRI